MCFLSLQIMMSKAKPKEVLLGSNKDEGSYFMAYLFPSPEPGESLMTHKQFTDALTQLLGLNSYTSSFVSIMYVSVLDSSPGKYRDALQNMLTDIVVVCPAEDFAVR